MGIIRPVISRMKGTITAAGNYFIPLKDTAQVTIDCSLIPVVELDDGSTVLLDFGNRLSDNLKALISQSWTNYGFLSADELRDEIASLQGIIRRSRNYTMSRVNTPLALTAKPEILVFPDWIIAAKKAVGGVLYRQGLFLLGGSEQPLPAGAGAVLEKNGLIVTEIAEGTTTCGIRYPDRYAGDSRPAGTQGNRPRGRASQDPRRGTGPQRPGRHLRTGA